MLRTAREASDDIRRKAEERSASVMEEAQAEAHRLRTEAAEILRCAPQEAEAVGRRDRRRSRGARRRAPRRERRAAEDQRLRAEQEAGRSSRARACKAARCSTKRAAARERVLADLGRRRSLLQAQVEELRQGRDRLLEAYRVVKRTFLDATEALAQVEARAARSARSRPGRTTSPARSPRPSPRPRSSKSWKSCCRAQVPRPMRTTPVKRLTRPRTRPHRPISADVDSLFARIRAGQTAAADDADADTPCRAAPSEPEVDASSPRPDPRSRPPTPGRHRDREPGPARTATRRGGHGTRFRGRCVAGAARRGGRSRWSARS